MPLDERQRLRQARARAGWEPPGPLPLGDRGEPDLLPLPDETLDAFAGHWRIFQLRHGHRYSTDDLLAAWFALDTLDRLGRSPGRSLDLGTGIGSVGMFLLWALPDLQLTGIEAQPRSLDLARRTARYNGVAARVTYREGDLRAGLTGLSPFELITGSPPYWDPADGTLSDGPQKAPCRFELRGGVEAYCEAAASLLAPEGVFVVVFDGRQRARLERAAQAAGLAFHRYRDVISKEGRAPLIALAALRHPAMAASVLVEGPLVLRDQEGARTDAFRTLRARMGLPPGR